jgi:uncharacterized membrane protein YjfL (UPF0719 family)
MSRDSDEHRDWLVRTHHTASRDFDKAVMTLAGGALGISVAFIHDVAPHPHKRGLLAVAWGLLALSLLLILISFLTSQRTLLNEIDAVDNRQSSPVPDRAGSMTDYLNWSSAAAFILGVVFVVAFALYNLQR